MLPVLVVEIWSHDGSTLLIPPRPARITSWQEDDGTWSADMHLDEPDGQVANTLRELAGEVLLVKCLTRRSEWTASCIGTLPINPVQGTSSVTQFMAADSVGSRLPDWLKRPV